MNLYIIYTDTDIIISKKFYNSWPEIQDENVNYKTSLGAWTSDRVIDFLQFEYPNLDPNPSIQIHEFIKSTDIVTTIQLEAP
jgi:hypothetical protein